jgi:transposase
MSKALENMTYEQLLEWYKGQEALIEEKRAIIEEKGVAIDKMQVQISQMQFQIDQMNRLLYGAKRERFIYNTDESQLTLPFDVPQEETSNMKCIGKEVTDQLELVPAKLFIKRFIRPKYLVVTDESQGEHKGVIAELLVFPIEKGIAGPGLLAQIMVDKFVDHLPVYRQIERFKREDIKLSSSTINGWQENICNLLEPLMIL